LSKAVPILFVVAGLSAPWGAQNPTAQTWGRNVAESPIAVTGVPSGVVEVQAANWGGLAADRAGDVWEWKSSAHPDATQVEGVSNAVSLGEGDGPFKNAFGVAATASGAVWTWGYDGGGQLCDGEQSGDKLPAAKVSGITNGVEVSGGASHLEILTSVGTVEGCGDNNFGQLGTGSFSSSSTPVEVKGLSGITAISAGSSFTLALDSSGTVWAWGQDNFGQLGDGETVNSDVPVEVPLPAPATEIYAGGSEPENGQSIALLSNGTVWAWGNDSWGQLGNGTTESYSDTPVRVNVPSKVRFKYVTTAGSASYALDASGNVWAWGSDNCGQLGDGRRRAYVLDPEQVAQNYAGLSTVADTVTGIG
jgi:alpha-tubulin suppressor-like RCC1 family protein